MGLEARTFIFANVFEGKGQACILSLDDADLAKGPFTDDTQETEVIEIDCRGFEVSDGSDTIA